MNAFIAGEYAFHYYGERVSTSFLHWVAEMRYGSEVESNWIPTSEQVLDFINGYFLNFSDQEKESEGIPETQELLNLLETQDQFLSLLDIIIEG